MVVLKAGFHYAIGHCAHISNNTVSVLVLANWIERVMAGDWVLFEILEVV